VSDRMKTRTIASELSLTYAISLQTSIACGGLESRVPRLEFYSLRSQKRFCLSLTNPHMFSLGSGAANDPPYNGDSSGKLGWNKPTRIRLALPWCRPNMI
jgi:hypothetical protein